MRGAALVNPVLLIVASLAGVGVARLAGFSPHLHELVLAVITALVASEISLIPHLLKIENTPAATFQAAFLGTVLHLALFLVQGVVIVLTIKPGSAFIWWLMPLYWVTLIGLCSIFIRTMRAPVESKTTATN